MLIESFCPQAKYAKYLRGAICFGVIVSLSSALSAQSDKNKRVADYIKRLDRNGNEILDKDEMVGGIASYLQSQGFDTSQPLSVNRVVRKIQGKSADENPKKTKSNGSVVRKVPGFGIEKPKSSGVTPFGAGSSGKAIDMNAKYGEQVMKLVNRTMEGYDSNKNGVLDANEIKRARWGKPSPEQSDTNRDGVISLIELAERYSARNRDSRKSSSSRSVPKVTVSKNNPRQIKTTLSSPGKARNIRTTPSRSTPVSKSGSTSFNSGNERYARYAAGLLTQYDQNKDGRLDKGEIGKMRRPPKGADADGDGFVTATELTNVLSAKTTATSTPTSPQALKNNRDAKFKPSATSQATSRPRPSGSFVDYDKNQDGQIQMSEFSEDWDGEIFSQFQQKDFNGDGLITSEEWNGRGR